MKKFEAKTLEEAYELASDEFKCSVTDLTIEIIQQPRKGFLGFGRKSAIITAICLRKTKKEFRRNDNRFKKSEVKIEEFSKKIVDEDIDRKEDFKYKHKINKNSKDEIFDNFYGDSTNKQDKNFDSKILDKDNIVEDVKIKINELFSHTCFELNEIKVEFYDEETLYVEFSGEDSALLIGKEGYRYKALSYILFNWINETYGLMLRLEVAEFLKNQEESINLYLEPIIEIVRDQGMCKTKPLDGILVHIALKRLREEFPDKYVAAKTNARGDRYVLVNEYRGNSNSKW